MDFNKAFELVIGHEGGYSSNARDRGNWTGGVIGRGVLKGTKYGIAANTYPTLDIKNLTLEDAKSIYLRDFWNGINMDNLPEGIRFDLFDTAVNSGVDRSIRILQKAISTDIDGKVGPNTIKAAHSLTPDRLKLLFNASRLEFLSDLGSWADFSRGWTKRVIKNMLMS